MQLALFYFRRRARLGVAWPRVRERYLEILPRVRICHSNVMVIRYSDWCETSVRRDLRVRCRILPPDWENVWYKLEVAQRVHISAKGHTLLKTGLSAHRHTDRRSRVRTVYPPVSLRSLGGYNKFCCKTVTCMRKLCWYDFLWVRCGFVQQIWSFSTSMLCSVFVR